MAEEHTGGDSRALEPPPARATFWRLADELRGTVDGRNPLAVLRVAAVRGLMPTWREQAEFAGEVGLAEAADPGVVATFLLALTDGDRPKRVLDPWAGLGITVSALEAEGRVVGGTAIEINQDVYEVIMALRQQSRIDWLLGDAAEVLPTLTAGYDLVVGSPPVNLPPTELSLGAGVAPLRASKSMTTLVQAARLLAPDGLLAIILPESWFGPRHDAVRDALRDLDVYPSASIALPARGFATAIPMSLVLFERSPQGDLFLAELDRAADPRPVIANLRERVPGRLPQLGTLVPAGAFTSWRSVVLGLEVATAARPAGLVATPIRDLCTSMRAVRKDGGFEPHPDAIYLPSIGLSPVVASPDLFVLKPHNYLQLIVDREQAEPEYLAGFLNSSLGRKVRQQASSGMTISHVTLSGLRGAIAYLPRNIEQQRAAVRTDRSLVDLGQSLGALRRQLWERPMQARSIAAELRTLLDGDGLDRWRESLPFPVASVLIRYEAEEEPERKVRYLISFFEALTLTLVDIHLSALRQDAKELLEAARGGAGGVTYRRGSLGVWTDLLSRLSKRARALASSQPTLAAELYRVSAVNRIETLASKALVAALKDEAAEYRNSWIGHSPMVGTSEWERRLAAAETTLARIRTAVGDGFVGWELIRAGQGGNRGGVVSTSIERLVGAQRAFRRSRIELREWPEEGALYLYEDGATLALSLAPLMTVGRGPDAVEDACYFYDRLDGEAVRWVSYHFADQAEMVRADAGVVELIAELDALG